MSIGDPIVDMKAFEQELGLPRQRPAEVRQFSPLVERTPELTGEAIRGAHEQAAARVEAAADALVEQLNDCLTTARDTAKAIRDFGEQQATTIEKATGMVRDMARLFRESKANLDAFKGGASA